MVVTAMIEGRRLILVVNGLKSEIERANESKRLLDIGFREFRTYALLKAGDSLGEASVWAGTEPKVSLVSRDPVKILLRRSQREGLKVTLSYMEPVLSPLKKGQEVGKLKITAPGMPDLDVPVVAGATVDEGGLMSQVERGLTGLFSGTPEPAPVSQSVTLPDGSGAASAGQ
jgi:D-alanyl-D-alanine carboxypeptidase (penicillin-binding protein 5/6)